jgi:hypothetical protein
MCSQPSRRNPPSPEEHADGLTQAIVDVAQESFFAFAEPCDGEQFTEALDATGCGGSDARWLKARIDFDGAFAGAVELKLPYLLAMDLAASLAGVMPGDEIAESDVVDSTGEFANMVCGTWLTRSCARRRFDLQPPCVRPLDAVPATVEPGAGTQLLLINDRPVSLTVSFQAA